VKSFETKPDAVNAVLYMTYIITRKIGHWGE